VKERDQISSLVCFLMAVFICLKSISLPMGSWSSPGPAFLPFGTGILLGLLSVILYLKASLSKSPKSEQSWFPKERRKGLALVLIASFLYAIFLDILGFLISTFLLFFVLLGFIEPQKWTVVVGGSLLISFASYALFELLLQVGLPRGFLGF
jgi:putative tricarboxylic transport membrane protein